MTTPARPTEPAEIREAAPYGIIDPDYARVFTIARCLAWQEGYALVMHGSFTRDLDLLAVPWTEKAVDAEHLVRRIAFALDELSLLETRPGAPWQGSEKPHGRHAWTFTFKAFGDPRFIDLSVMPRAAHAATAQAERTAGELAAAKAEILALLAPSPAERPCDCEHCYCGNSGDLAAVAAWDAERRLHDAAVAIFDRSALTEEPPHAAE